LILHRILFQTAQFDLTDDENGMLKNTKNAFYLEIDSQSICKHNPTRPWPRAGSTGDHLMVRLAFWSVLIGLSLLITDLQALEKCSVGVTRRGTPIEGWAQANYFDLDFQGQRILVVGGVYDQESVERVKRLSDEFDSPSKRAVAFIPDLYPDAEKGNVIVEQDLAHFYRSSGNPEVQYLIGWAAYHVTDCIVILSPSAQTGVKANEVLFKHHGGEFLDTELIVPDEPLGYPSAILAGSKHYGIRLEVIELPSPQRRMTDHHWITKLSEVSTKSAARLDFQKRVLDVDEKTEQLLAVYGRSMKTISYIPALAMMAQYQSHRYGRKNGLPVAQLNRIVESHLKRPLPDNGSGIAGHLVLFSALESTNDDAWKLACKERILEVADLYHTRPTEYQGQRLMPYHSEMSDAVFMGGPILALADTVTREFNDPRYSVACASHLQACAKMNQLANGLYQHSPQDSAAWGRGNGFAALGTSICLGFLSPETEGYEQVQANFVRHIEALVKHQDKTGSWHQVIDHPESYPEFTSTCMITSAIVLGIQSHALKMADYQSVILRARQATLRRIAPGGFINDVCTGTGKQKNLRAYYDREAIQGRNDRAGAMALLLFTLLEEVELNESKR